MESNTRQTRAFKTETPIVLDGDMKKRQGVESVTFEGRPLAGHPRRATVYTLWDSENLYLAFDVHSSKLRAEVREHDGDKQWEDDGSNSSSTPTTIARRVFILTVSLATSIFSTRSMTSAELPPVSPTSNGPARPSTS
jgi:hypothetical protein